MNIMDADKKVYKFNGRLHEDFHLWQARTEAALEAKEVLDVVLTDCVGAGAA